MISKHQYGWLGQGASAGETANPYLFPTAGATEVWYFNMPSGDLVGQIQGDTYSAGGTLEYEVAGPSGSNLLGVRANAGGEKFLLASADSDLNIGTSDFTFMIQLQNEASTTAAYFMDFGFGGANSEGMAAYFDANYLDFYIVDSSNARHITRYFHAGALWNDGTFRTFRWTFSFSDTKGRLFIKEAGSAESEVSTYVSSNNLSALSGVTFNGDGIAFLGRENDNILPINGVIYQVALAVGTTTYDADSKP